MASSAEVYNQIQNTLGQLNPMLNALPGADKYYQDAVNKAYQYNLPVMQNAAQLESQLYSMPGQQMAKYDQEFGGKTGVDAATRIQSILSGLGRQSALANTAWGLVDNANMRTNDLAKSLADQYRTKIEATQARLQPQMQMWDRLFSEEQANKRAGGSGYTSPDWDKIAKLLNGDGNKKPTTTTGPGNTQPQPQNASTLDKLYQTARLFGINPQNEVTRLGNWVGDKVPLAKTIGNVGLNLFNQYNTAKSAYNKIAQPIKNIWGK